MDNKTDSINGQSKIHSRDADFTIEISEDRLKALGTFEPPKGAGVPLDNDFIQKRLDQANITNGVDWPAIEEASQRCNLDHEQVQDVTVAMGKVPVKYRPSYIKLKKRFLEKPKPDPKAIRFDFHKMKSYQVVKAGEIIGQVIPKREGEEGTDVLGGSVQPGKLEIITMKPGKNVSLQDGKVVCDKSGRLVKDKDQFFVEEVMEIAGDVDYHTGNVEFPGDVVLKGTVKDGFKLHVGGTLASKESVDASDILVKKDFIVEGGIIGKGKALVKTGGNIRTKFIEQCHVECAGNVAVKSLILGSTVKLTGALTVEEGGTLAGSKVVCAGGGTLSNLGNEAGADTIIECGFNFIKAARAAALEERLFKGQALKQELTDKYAASPDETVMKKLHEVEEKLNLILEELERQKAQMYDQTGFKLNVTGTVFPGVQIRMHRFKIDINQKQNSVSFRLDETAGKIVTEQLGKDKKKR